MVTKRSYPPRQRRVNEARSERLRQHEADQAQAIEASQAVLNELAARRDATWQRAAAENRRRARLVLSLPFLPGVVIGLLGLLLLPLGIVGVVLLLSWGVLALIAKKRGPRVVAGAVGGLDLGDAERQGLVGPAEAERYRGLAEALCAALGLGLPELYVIDDPVASSIACGEDPHARLVVTTGLLARLDRIELEGVIAHELSHIKRLDTLTAGLCAVLTGGRRLPASRRLAAWLEGSDRELSADLAAVEVTRYPPGLEGALRVAVEEDGAASGPLPGSLSRRGEAASGSQWLLPVPASEPREGSFGPTERIQLLAEL